MTENTQVQQLFRDATSGRLNRREVFQRGIALGLSANVIGMLALNAVKSPSALAAEEGKPTGTFYDWMINLHPRISSLGEELGMKVETAPTENFGNDRFIAEANDQMSTWDFYGGVTPFLEMIGLAESGTIEPWTQYLPEGLAADFVPATMTEGTYKGEFYVWPLLLDINVQMRNTGITTKAGLDPEESPATWDDFIAAGQKVMDSGAAPYGIVWDNRDWRSLIPVTHSISVDVYDKETGLFQYASDAAVEALEIMKRMMPLGPADILDPGAVDNNVKPDEAAFAAEQAGFYFKYQNAGFQFSANWPDPSLLRLGALPKTPTGVGGTVFWDTGAVLFTYGSNKPAAVSYLEALSKDEQMWKESVTGNPDEGTIPVGQLPVLNSVWAAWAATPPDWYTANPWMLSVLGSLQNASAIAPNILGIKQFDIARPEWHKYLSGEVADAKTAGQAAQDAALAEYEKAIAAPSARTRTRWF
ncbi:MAG TPA: extracellular solute-binding protein [Thermomicrobiales bacterium]|nr:extracellular solute-binding protein [Thermomicrobiales bacterium]